MSAGVEAQQLAGLDHQSQQELYNRLGSQGVSPVGGIEESDKTVQDLSKRINALPKGNKNHKFLLIAETCLESHKLAIGNLSAQNSRSYGRTQKGDIFCVQEAQEMYLKSLENIKSFVEALESSKEPEVDLNEMALDLYRKTKVANDLWNDWKLNDHHALTTLRRNLKHTPLGATVLDMLIAFVVEPLCKHWCQKWNRQVAAMNKLNQSYRDSYKEMSESGQMNEQLSNELYQDYVSAVEIYKQVDPSSPSSLSPCGTLIDQLKPRKVAVVPDSDGASTLPLFSSGEEIEIELKQYNRKELGSADAGAGLYS